MGMGTERKTWYGALIQPVFVLVSLALVLLRNAARLSCFLLRLGLGAGYTADVSKDDDAYWEASNPNLNPG